MVDGVCVLGPGGPGPFPFHFHSPSDFWCFSVVFQVRAAVEEQAGGKLSVYRENPDEDADHWWVLLSHFFLILSGVVLPVCVMLRVCYVVRSA